jgi:hypothetical protein
LSGDPIDLFVSYQQADEAFASRVAAAIEAAGEGLRVFFAPWDIAPGKSIVSEIDEALARARFFGLVLSPEYLLADWTSGETSAAIFADPGGRLGRVIPIMHTKCQLPALLRFRRYVDFDGLGFDLGITFLICVLKGRPLPRGGNSAQGARGPTGHGDTTSFRTLLDGMQADQVPDSLYPNIFPVTVRPRSIWNAPTRVKSGKDLFQYYGHDRPVPPFILADGRLYTFANLSKERHAFTGVVEDYDVVRQDWEHWTKDPERAKRLHWLLDDSLREKMRGLRMSYERRGRKFYYDQGVLKEQKFKAFARGSGKDFVINYGKKGGTFVAHRAVNLRFILFGADPFLRVESGWVFKDLTGELIVGRRRIVLNSRFTSGQRNAANFNEVRFWTWFLAGDDPILRLSLGDHEALEVRVAAEPLQVEFGILGDQHALSPVQAAPDLQFEDEDGGGPLDHEADAESSDEEGAE